MSQLGSLGLGWMGSQSQLGALGAGVGQGLAVFPLSGGCAGWWLWATPGLDLATPAPLPSPCILLPASCLLPAPHLLPTCSPPALHLLPACILLLSCSCVPVPPPTCAGGGPGAHPTDVGRAPALSSAASAGAHQVRPSRRQQRGDGGVHSLPSTPALPTEMPRVTGGRAQGRGSR